MLLNCGLKLFPVQLEEEVRWTTAWGGQGHVREAEEKKIVSSRWGFEFFWHFVRCKLCHVPIVSSNSCCKYCLLCGKNWLGAKLPTYLLVISSFELGMYVQWLVTWQFQCKLYGIQAPMVDPNLFFCFIIKFISVVLFYSKKYL